MINRGLKYLRNYGLKNVVRKSILIILRLPKGVQQLLRKIRFHYYTGCWVQRIMGPVHIAGLGNRMKMGKDAALYPGVVFEISEQAAVTIGNHFTLSYGAIIASRHSISIGDHVMIGEYTSIRDTTHTYDDVSENYSTQQDHSEGIAIGNNVWIGRGCILLPGTIIEDGVIVGANSVVKGRLNTRWIYAGSPAKPIKPVSAGTL